MAKPRSPEAEAKEDGTWVEPDAPRCEWVWAALACAVFPAVALLGVWALVYAATHLFGASFGRELLETFPNPVTRFMVPAFVHEHVNAAQGAAPASSPDAGTCASAGTCEEGFSLDEL